MLKKLSLNLLNELGNFNEVFGKVVTYDNIKSYNKVFILSLEDAFLEKPQGVVKLTPILSRAKT